jgi:hypothetical protein
MIAQKMGKYQKIKSFVIVMALFIAIGYSQANNDSLDLKFQALLDTEWQEIFADPFTTDWQNNWFLDGEEATLSNSDHGLDFWAGPNAWDDTSHAVLWTKQSFEGDLRIEYEFTRLDTSVRFVNIIYILATGSGESGFGEDISEWNEYRRIPTMSHYFRNMHTYHISYAAFGTRNHDPEEDYVRARRYMPSFGGLSNTNLEPDYARTGLFKTGVPHKITIIKKGDEIFMHVTNNEQSRLFYWKNDKFPPVLEGRIGLRHMYTRGSRYADFRVSVPAK